MGRGASAQLEFIHRAQDVHGDKYDYSFVQYSGSREKVRIICKVHGDFWQAPFSHLAGRGCPKCGQESRKQTMLARYGYEYSMQTPEGLSKTQQARVNMFGSMRSPSSGCRALTTEAFIFRARMVHGSEYDYSETVYQNMRTRVRIICPKHGAFEQYPANHLSGSGCPHLDCVRARRKVR